MADARPLAEWTARLGEMHRMKQAGLIGERDYEGQKHGMLASLGRLPGGALNQLASAKQALAGELISQEDYDAAKHRVLYQLTHKPEAAAVGLQRPPAVRAPPRPVVAHLPQPHARQREGSRNLPRGHSARQARTESGRKAGRRNLPPGKAPGTFPAPQEPSQSPRKGSRNLLSRRRSRPWGPAGS